jgi:hypothetical protein
MNYHDANNPQPLSEAFRYEIDNRPEYNNLYVIYRGSAGGVDTLRIRGVFEKDADYLLQQTGRVKKPYYDEGSKITPTQYQQPAQETINYKGDVGHLKKEEQDRLRDMYLQRELYQVKNKRWWPINLTIKSFTIQKSTDKLWSLPIEFSLANDGDKFYAPPAADFGNEYADSNTCSAYVENIVATRQLINGDTICEVTFTFDVAGGISNKVQYRSSNNLGFGLAIVWKDLVYPYAAPLVLRFPAGPPVSVFFRAICTNTYGGITNGIDIDTSASDTGGGGGGGGTVGVNNSRIINDSSTDALATVRVNGVQILSKIVKHKTAFSILINSVFFYIADTANAHVQVDFTSFSPSTGTIDSNGALYHGVIDPVTGSLIFNGVNIVNGMIIGFQ